jgi:hypothetical protein
MNLDINADPAGFSLSCGSGSIFPK